MFNKLRNYHWISLSIIIIGIISFVILARNNGNGNGNGKQLTETSWRVAVKKAERGKFKPTVILHGITESPRESTLEAAIEADVIKTPFDEGMTVKKATVILYLDPSDANLLLQQREAEAASLKADIEAEKIRYNNDQLALKYEKQLHTLAINDVKRHEYLVRTKVGAAVALDNAKRTKHQTELAIAKRELAIKDHINRMLKLKAQLNGAIAKRGQAALDLKRTKIIAPFDGKITKLQVSVGDRVQNGTALISVFDTSRVEIRTQIPTPIIATLYQALRQGIPLTATTTLNKKTIKLSLVRIAGKIASGQGGVDALFAVAEKQPDLALGRATEIKLELPALKDVYAIPMQAVYGNNRIYIVKQDRMQSIPITRVGTQRTEDGAHMALFTSEALKPGDLMITTALPNARNGLKVSIK